MLGTISVGRSLGTVESGRPKVTTENSLVELIVQISGLVARDATFGVLIVRPKSLD
jgi:hypothetical protein